MVRAPSRLVRNLMAASGMLQPNGIRFPALFRIYSWMCYLSSGYLCFGCIAFIALSDDTMARLTSVGIFITILNGFIKHHNTMFKSTETMELLDEFDKGWDDLYKDPINRAWMDPIANICLKLYKLIFYFLGGMVSLNATVPVVLYFIAGYDKPAFQISLPYQKKWNFAVAHLFTLAMAVCPTVTNLTHNFLYFALSKQLGLFVSVLRRSLREGELSKEVYQAHQKVIRMTMAMNERFSHILFFETNTVSIETSCSIYIMFKVNIVNKKFENVVPALVNVIFCLVIPYIICYCGDVIRFESEGILTDAFSSEWWTKDRKTKKNLQMVMMAARKPLALRYKNLAVFNLELFLGILHATYTFLNAIVWLENLERHN